MNRCSYVALLSTTIDLKPNSSSFRVEELDCAVEENEPNSRTVRLRVRPRNVQASGQAHVGLLRAAHPVRRPARRQLDATAGRKAGVLRVDAVHEDMPFTKAMTIAVNREIDDLAAGSASRASTSEGPLTCRPTPPIQIRDARCRA